MPRAAPHGCRPPRHPQQQWGGEGEPAAAWGGGSRHTACPPVSPLSPRRPAPGAPHGPTAPRYPKHPRAVCPRNEHPGTPRALGHSRTHNRHRQSQGIPNLSVGPVVGVTAAQSAVPLLPGDGDGRFPPGHSRGRGCTPVSPRDRDSAPAWRDGDGLPSTPRPRVGEDGEGRTAPSSSRQRLPLLPGSGFV